jgi:prevent-host-death family protein
MNASSKDLRIHARRILQAVDRGEEVTITHRGTPRAKLVPIRSSAKGRARSLPGFGMWSDHADTKEVSAYVRRLRRWRR